MNCSAVDWTTPNLAETFKILNQRMELYLIVNKIKAKQQVSNILLKVGDEELKRYNSLTLTRKEKGSPDIIICKFLEQVEPKENRVNRRIDRKQKCHKMTL